MLGQSIIDLAAMSINGALFNILAAATAPLCVGTTALVSQAQGRQRNIHAQKGHNSDLSDSNNTTTPTISSLVTYSDESYRILINGLFLSLITGITLNILSIYTIPTLIKLLFKPTTAVLTSAVTYFKIRMLSLPFTLANYVIVGFSLGTQHILAPIISIIISLLINICGDYIFISIFKLGLKGAAIATTLSSVFGSSLAVYILLYTYYKSYTSNNTNNKSNNDNKSIHATTTNTTTTTSESENTNTITNNNNNILAKFKAKLRGIYSTIKSYTTNNIDINIITKLFSTSGLLFTGSMLNTLTYSSLTKIAATTTGIHTPIHTHIHTLHPTSTASTSSLTSSIGSSGIIGGGEVINLSTIHMSAHQLTMQSWWFLSYFSSPISLIAQSLLPREIEAKNNIRIKLLLKYIIRLTYSIAIIMTILNMYISLYTTRYFTSSQVILYTAKSILIQSSLSQLIICITTALDGVFIGSDKIYTYIKACLISTLSAWIYFLYAVYKGEGLTGAWNGLLIFGVVRLVYFGYNWNKVSGQNYEDKESVV